MALFCGVKGVPKHLNYAFAILAIGVEGFLFANHLNDGMRDPNDVQIHTLLVFSILACFVASLMEAFGDKKVVVFSLMRCVAFLWQGVWFYHLGFTLFPMSPERLKHNHLHEMINIIHFLSYLGACVVFTALLGVLVFFCMHRRLANSTKNNDEIKFQKLTLLSDDDDLELSL